MPAGVVRFTAIGHVTNDLLASGVAPGGSVTYAALAAVHLGARARVITSCAEDFVGRALLDQASVEVEVKPAAHTTTFENLYADGRRRSRLLAIAESLGEPARDADVVLACPVAGEVAAGALVGPAGGLLAAGLQGWLRRFGAGGVVERDDGLDPAILRACDAVFVSREDLGPAVATLLPRLVETVRIVVCTDGAAGADLWVEGRAERVPVHPAWEVDPTGAGDVFAVAFLLALRAGEPPARAARTGAAAASIVVEGVGPESLPRLRDELAGRVAALG